VALTKQMKHAIYKKYLLIVLLVILSFNYMDRLVLGLLLQDIKADLSLSDTQLGLLTGIASSLFYALMGIPIARWADRGNRVTIIAISTALWCAAVALCGVATNFLQLLLVRIGAAVGEAGCVPPAYSLIADYFDRAERPKAVAIYNLGGPLSAVLGYLLAGWLNEHYGWRATFILLGLPGIGLAVLAWTSLREPRRLGRTMTLTNADTRPISDGALENVAQPSLTDAWMTLWHNPTFRHMLIGFSVLSFFGAGIAQWSPAFFMRSYGLGSAELGRWLTVIFGLGSLLGTSLAAVLAARYAAHNERAQLKITAIAYCSFGFISAAVYDSNNRYIAFALTALIAVGTYVVSAPFLAILQTLVPERMRAVSIAVFLLFSSFIGLGLGPLAAGILSDRFRPWAGEESLRYSLMVLSPGYLWGAWHYWRASTTVTGDLESAEEATRRRGIAVLR